MHFRICERAAVGKRRFGFQERNPLANIVWSITQNYRETQNFALQKAPPRLLDIALDVSCVANSTHYTHTRFVAKRQNKPRIRSNRVIYKTYIYKILSRRKVYISHKYIYTTYQEWQSTCNAFIGSHAVPFSTDTDKWGSSKVPSPQTNGLGLGFGKLQVVGGWGNFAKTRR